MIIRLATLAALVAAGPAALTSGQPTAGPHHSLPIEDDLLAQGRQILAAADSALIAFRHDLHRHPEVSGREVRTAAEIAKRLRSAGLEVTTGVGGHGVVGILRGAKPGPVVAYRADIDAVPSQAPDPAPYASVVSGVRHICGHDVHAAVALGLALALSGVREELPGTVMFLFQPEEETARGARAMLDHGVFDSITPIAIYGLHTSGYETGIVATRAGPMMAGRDRAIVNISGPGDLASIVAEVSGRLAQLGSPRLAPGSSVPANHVLYSAPVPQISAGRAVVRAVYSHADPATSIALQRIVAEELPRLAPPGVEISTSFAPRFIDGVTNDSALTLRAIEALTAVLGTDSVARPQGVPAGPSEDFGAFQRRIPGVFFFLGVSNHARGWRGMPHAPDYVADDRAIGVGATAMLAVILDRLESWRP